MPRELASLAANRFRGEPREMKEAAEQSSPNWGDVPTRRWNQFLKQRENPVFLLLALLIGALVGAVVVAFIVLTEHVGTRLYPNEAAAWRRVLVPIAGSLVMGYL